MASPGGLIMSQAQSVSQNSEGRLIAPTETVPPLKFARNNAFQNELRRRVDEYFKVTGKKPRDCPPMYLKTAILLILFAAVYTLLVFFVNAWWQAVPLAIFLGMATAEIGFNVQHDGSHLAFSKHTWINKLMA